MEKALHQKVQEIGSASLRNFAYAAKTWFRADLEVYNFALMPVAFETPFGTLKTLFAENTRACGFVMESGFRFCRESDSRFDATLFGRFA